MAIPKVTAILKDIRRRKVRDPEAVDTFRCARLADVSKALADLASTGHAVVAPNSKRILSARLVELVQLIHHIDVQVFGRDGTRRVARYSKGVNAYYAGERRLTAEKEIKFYVTSRFVIDRPDLEQFDFDVFKVEFFASFRDLCGLEKRHPELVADDKRIPQAVGSELQNEATIAGLRVPSARDRQRDGHSFANWVSFRRGALTPIGIIGTLRYDIPYDKNGRRRAPKRTFFDRSLH